LGSPDGGFEHADLEDPFFRAAGGENPMTDFGFVVIGSGFGGAVTACRMAERGESVLVLERGRRWEPEAYPSKTDRDFLYDPDDPVKQNGWIDLRVFEGMMVAQGAGVGGGSLVYANVSVGPPDSTFARGWPEALTPKELEPYVARVGQMLEVAVIPERQRTRRWKLVREGAEALGQLARFDSLPLAVTFREDYVPDDLVERDERGAEERTNRQGRKQRTCVHLGYCDLGCPVLAKNTLDLNYLARAEDRGAEIRPLHLVRRVERAGTAWRVHFDRIEPGERLVPGSVTADRVVLAAGSLGSTELLLRSALPGVSRRLGFGWSANGDFLTPALYNRKIIPTRGPTISARIDHTDGEVYGESIFIQDGGIPDLLRIALGERLKGSLPGSLHRRLRDSEPELAQRSLFQNVMPWFAQGIDASDGRLRLRKRLFGLFGKERLALDWDVAGSKRTIDAIVQAHEQLARATGGKPVVSPFWTIFRDLITPHPLGGCNMADDPSQGVVDHAGRVFGHENLYVVDGSVIPRAIGRNPSRTIAAVAERAVEQWGR
jgi:cholesterol oxidase